MYRLLKSGTVFQRWHAKQLNPWFYSLFEQKGLYNFILRCQILFFQLVAIWVGKICDFSLKGNSTYFLLLLPLFQQIQLQYHIIIFINIWLFWTKSLLSHLEGYALWCIFCFHRYHDVFWWGLTSSVLAQTLFLFYVSHREWTNSMQSEQCSGSETVLLTDLSKVTFVRKTH